MKSYPEKCHIQAHILSGVISRSVTLNLTFSSGLRRGKWGTPGRLCKILKRDRGREGKGLCKVRRNYYAYWEGCFYCRLPMYFSLETSCKVYRVYIRSSCIIRDYSLTDFQLWTLYVRSICIFYLTQAFLRFLEGLVRIHDED